MTEAYDGPLLAASRDASVLDRPNTYSPKKVHVAVHVVRISGATWWDSNPMHGEAACDPDRVPLDMTVAKPAASVEPIRRCARTACARLWPEVFS